MWSFLIIISISLFSCIKPSFAACGSCLVGSSVAVIGSQRLGRSLPHKNLHHHGVGAGGAAAIRPVPRLFHHHHHINGPWKSALTSIAINQLSTHFGTSILGHSLSRYHGNILRSAEEKENETIDMDMDGKGDEESKPVVSAGMVAAIGVYKNWISPLLPPACRFVPTCSQYGVQAIEEFGPQKGIILTAWRLLRCSPFGGKGYDPPKWPPVAYTYGSY